MRVRIVKMTKLQSTEHGFRFCNCATKKKTIAFVIFSFYGKKTNKSQIINHIFSWSALLKAREMTPFNVQNMAVQLA